VPVLTSPGDPSHGYPFFSTTVSLAARDYVEEEFFFEGMASGYIVADPLSTATVAPGSATPYRTRMVVRRPRTPNNFNGTVIMEWQNVTVGYDFDALWIQSSEHLMRRGYAWIGVSAQRAGVHAPRTGLKAWSPVRYGPLNVPSDLLSHDIFSQAVQAVRHPQGVDPMAGLAVKHVFAAGASQAAVFLTAYHNSISPLAGGIDAFAILLSGSTLRTDLDVKVFKLLSETDVAGSRSMVSQAWLRQPDLGNFRRWEVAGTAHLDYHLAQEVSLLQIRDGLGAGLLAAASCDYPPFSHIPLYFVANAMYDQLVGWVEGSGEPAHGQDIEVTSVSQQVSTLARDGFGNVLGGIRLSQHVVPVATNTGINFPDLPATNFCRTFGSHVAFDGATLSALYRNHGTYVSKVSHATAETVWSGFVVPEDAEATIGAAAHSDIGHR
jgi:hypothetical protein